MRPNKSIIAVDMWRTADMLAADSASAGSAACATASMPDSDPTLHAAALITSFLLVSLLSRTYIVPDDRCHQTQALLAKCHALLSLMTLDTSQIGIPYYWRCVPGAHSSL